MRNAGLSCYTASKEKSKEGRAVQAEARITSKGQVTIPRDIRRVLHVEEGDTVIFDVVDDGVRIRPRHTGTVQAFVGACRVGEGKTAADIVAEVRRLREG